MEKTLLEVAKELPAANVAVVAAESEVAIKGALESADAGFINPIFVGDKELTLKAAQEANLLQQIEKYEFIDIKEHIESSAKSVELALEGKVDAIMKGSLHTSELFGPIIKSPLRISRFSHCALFEVEGSDSPMIWTDAALNVSPDLELKKYITKNAISFCKGLNIDPRIVFLSAVEDVTDRIPDTHDAKALTDMVNAGEFGEGIVADGPLAFDCAISAELAAVKNINSPVAGNANLFVTPNLIAANIATKLISHMVPLKAPAGGFVLGAKVPVIVTSRSDNSGVRMASCALAQIWSHNMKGNN